ncbi:MAG: type I-E CRISPR-associated protein Cas7/Cse4/CasC [Pseudoclavibacter sp.]|nr:type I-E CRISPR-associated protein Cas7/Cse4/CasC [Pseudoclavibacter sp.]
MTLYLDIHALQTVPPSCLNRDDTGSPKSAQFGGVKRARVSSQAWKRAVRNDFARHLDASELGERTLRIVDRIAARVAELDPSLADRAEDLVTAMLKSIKIKVEKKKKEGDEAPRPQTHYLIFASRAQIDRLAQLLVETGAEGKPATKDVKQAFHDANSIDVALFGRMITEEPDLNVDAACQVAHAISVHAAENEFDYFTAVDDNQDADNAGAGMIGTVEFVSSTMYRYATVNASELADSLGSVEAAARAVEAFLRSFVTSMPTGKQNTFANRTRPAFVLVELREDQPVNLVGAFEEAIESTSGVAAEAVERLARRAVDEDTQYGTAPVRSAYLATEQLAAAVAGTGLSERAERGQLDELVRLAGDAVRELSEQ